MKGIAVAMFVLSPAAAWATLISSNLCHLAPLPRLPNSLRHVRRLCCVCWRQPVGLEDGPKTGIHMDMVVTHPTIPRYCQRGRGFSIARA